MGDPIKKSTGINKSERHLTALCEKTFLSLWSYPNPYRANPSGPNREICDLLVVCDDAVIIFSDKCCEFGNSGDPIIDWKRWYRRTVEAGGKQIIGAERILRAFPDRVFTDASCEHPLPPRLPLASKMRVHRIVVARGAANRCRNALGQSGSLMLSPGELTNAVSSPPFHVGDPFPYRGFVHILDDVTLELLLRELDTVTDFLDYLDEKERFIRAGRLYKSPGEEHLLAWYLQRMNADESRHEIYCPVNNQLSLKGSEWDDFVASGERSSRTAADQVSYAWDELIETFSRHLLNGTLVMHEECSVPEIEQGLRIMAKERRLGRRGLSEAVAGALHKKARNKAFVRSIYSSNNPSLVYVFAICPKKEMSAEAYSKTRRQYLSDYCCVLSFRLRQVKTVIGIAMQPLDAGDSGNFDMVALASPTWDAEQKKTARAIRMAWAFQSESAIDRWEATDYEYPSEAREGEQHTAANAMRSVKRSNPERIGRNSPCPCGSGRKHKYCCRR